MSQTVSSRELLGLAWPIVLTRSTQAVIGLSDALMVAPLGEEALAAASTGAMNFIAVATLPAGTVFILQSFAAQLRGRGELGSARRYAWYGLLLAAGTGLLAAALRPFVSGILSVFAYAPAVREAMTIYVSVRLLSIGPIVASEALGNWYSGLGNTRLAMISGIVAMVANVAGCFVLILPRFGLPGWGVLGAAWASVLASVAGLLVVAIPFLMGWGYERVAGRLDLKARELWRVLQFGVPNGFTWFLEFSAFTVFLNVAVARLGTTALAAMNVVAQINSIAGMPVFGLTSAGAILIGERLGRRAHDEVWPIVRLTGLVAGGWMVSVGLVYLVIPHVLLGAFVSESAPGEGLAFLHVGATMLALSALWQLFDAVGLTMGEALLAAGDTVWCMTVRIAAGWLLFVPLTWVTAILLHGGIVAVVGALVVYLAVLALALTWRFASGRWKEIDLVDSAEPRVV